MKKLIFIQLFIVLLLSSCLVGKRYARPEFQVPEKYVSGDTLVVTGDSASALASKDTTLNLQWFELFSDTVLNNLIKVALDSSTNLHIAVLRVDQARSFIQNFKSCPMALDRVSRLRQTLQILNQIISIFSELLHGKLISGVRLRHAKRAAYADMIASEEGLKTIKTTIVSDVASLYFLLRDLDNRIEVTKQTITSRSTYYKMVNQRYLKGESAELDKLQAEQQLALAQATLSSLKRELSFTERSMNILLGQNPQPIPRGNANADQVIIPDVPAGLPSTLLERRPDVVAAENTLIAETERIGVYQAMRFPSFSLTGFFGVAST